MSEKHESEHHPDPTVARGIKHSLNWAGECVHWCRACEANTRAGLNPDGTPIDRRTKRPRSTASAPRTRRRCRKLAEVTAERDALKRRVEDLEDGYTRGLIDADL
jgi:hypothetical protein